MLFQWAPEVPSGFETLSSFVGNTSSDFSITLPILFFSKQKQPDIDFKRLVFFVSLDEKTDCAQDVQKTDRLLFVLSYLTDGIKFS